MIPLCSMVKMKTGNSETQYDEIVQVFNTRWQCKGFIVFFLQER